MLCTSGFMGDVMFACNSLSEAKRRLNRKQLGFDTGPIR